MYPMVIDILMTLMYCNSTENKGGATPRTPVVPMPMHAARHLVHDLRVKFSTCLCSFPG